MNASKINAPTTIKIGSTLTIGQVAQYYKDWKTLPRANIIYIDASEVNNIDTAGLQLLIFTLSKIKNNNIDINWEPKPSQFFINQAMLAGMMNALNLVREI